MLDWIEFYGYNVSCRKFGFRKMLFGNLALTFRLADGVALVLAVTCDKYNIKYGTENYDDKESHCFKMAG